MRVSHSSLVQRGRGMARRAAVALTAALVILGAWILSSAYAGAASAASSAAWKFAKPRRAHDPWVLRCVLDDRPRMVVLALSHELWTAYDATTCGLYRAWRGGVNFQGSVYNDAHGPQPVSQGESFFHQPAPAAWTVTRGGTETPIDPIFLGYTFSAGHERVTLHFGIDLPGGTRVHIDESPEYVPVPDGRVSLIRALAVRGLPTDATLTLDLGGAAGATQIHVAGAGRLAAQCDARGAPVRPMLVIERDGEVRISMVWSNGTPIGGQSDVTAHE